MIRLKYKESEIARCRAIDQQKSIPTKSETPTDDEYKIISKDIIRDCHNATLEDIRRSIQECKNSQQYEESEIALRGCSSW
eukprot:scaffold40737_cov42-Cyclotella_meneghiniana.AAC.4